MYTYLIVDDEMIERKGIRINVINFSKEQKS